MTPPPMLWYHEQDGLSTLTHEPMVGAVPYMLARPMPIETAPRDGTWILGYFGIIGSPSWLTVQYADGMWLDEFDNDAIPTHWLPLPPAPEAA